MGYCRLPATVLPPSSVRTAFAHNLLANLSNSVPRAKAQLRGSLATGRSDAYSDIDIAWEIPDDSFQNGVQMLSQTLSSVGELESIRIDPEFRSSKTYKLIFVRYKEMPLFWRVDLEIFATSAQLRVPEPDEVTNMPADWSLPESALSNVIAAVKACQRVHAQLAEQLIGRAFARLAIE